MMGSKEATRSRKSIVKDQGGARVETYLDLDPQTDYSEVLDRVKEMRSIRIPCMSEEDTQEEMMMKGLQDKAMEQGISFVCLCPVCFMVRGKHDIPNKEQVYMCDLDKI